MAQQERIELRFSPGNPDERDLIAALEAEGDVYGAKGRFLKARLVKGYYAIMKEVESIQKETDPLEALDRLAQSVNSGHYRVLRALLSERPAAARSGPENAVERRRTAPPALELRPAAGLAAESQAHEEGY